MSSRGQVLDRCAALPAAEVSYPFGEATAVFKVRGKMFALIDLASEHGRVTLKADPGHAAALVQRHPQVSPGYYMNKRHWVTVNLADLADTPARPFPAGLRTELLEDSYELVVGALPGRLRPVPPVPVRPRQSAPPAPP